ncbi:MAG: beta strand repeat-containing protein, partial [Candidatus Hodarchaeales archaeon]
QDINLPGVNTEGTQNTTGSAASLTTARNIGGVSFNGTRDINLPGVNTEGTQNTTGSATKIAGIENSNIVQLDDNQTLRNKTLIDAFLNENVYGTAISNDATMTSNSTTKLATQQSIKTYVDSVAQGLKLKDSCRVATTENITLSGTPNIDEVPIANNDRVLVKNQPDSAENGIYIVNDSGNWSRSSDLAEGANAASVFVFIESGSTNGDSGWVCISDTGTAVVGTDPLSFSQFSGAGQITAGDGMTKTGNILDVVGGTGITANANDIAIDSTVVVTITGDQTINDVKTFSTVNATTLQIAGTSITATADELNILDGVTATADELNILDGVTATTAELNILDGVTATTTELNILDGVTATTAELNILDGVTATADELNILDGVTATTAELNILDGVTATADELNILDGVTATTTELNILDGVTATANELNILDGSSAGTIVNNKAVVYGSSGEVNAIKLKTLDASGDDVEGNSLILEGGAGTGKGIGGNIVFQTVTAGIINGEDVNTEVDEKMIITGNGNVGIGTNTPNGKLHIFEETGTAVTATEGTLILEHNNSGGESSILFKSKVNTRSDFGFIKYDDNGAANGSNTETSLLEIGVQNDDGGDNNDELKFSVPGGFMYMKADGNVGIGTDNPQQKLDISGGHLGVRSKDENTDSVIYIGAPFIQETDPENPTSAYKGAIYFQANATEQGYSTGTLHICNRDVENNNNTGNLISAGVDDARISILPNGNVGIGTTDPQIKLDIQGDGTLIKLKNTVEPETRCTIVFDTDTDNDWELGARGSNGQPDNAFYIYRTDTNGGNYAMIIDENRNVGIGTTDPEQKLDVNGNIHIRGDSGATAFSLLNDSDGLLRFRQNGGVFQPSGYAVGGTVADVMVIAAAGRVGIGTDNFDPNDRFKVGGGRLSIVYGGTDENGNESHAVFFSAKTNIVNQVGTFRFRWARSSDKNYNVEVIMHNNGNDNHVAGFFENNA